jgi:cytochrome c-type biogenesis protein CcmF
MIGELGAFMLALALALSVAQTALGGLGRLRRDPVLQGGAMGASVAAFAAIAVSFAALTVAYLTSDFSLLNVANNSHTDKPLIYKIAGVWGNHEGSLLLWCLTLTGCGAAVAVFGRRLPAGLHTLTVATQGALGVLFIAFAVFASNPFERLDIIPMQGRSLNPLLQDPALALHPPFLYAGYVGFSVVFSLAVAALIEGRVEAAWARWVRPWTLGAWSMLTVGITLGSFWAYYELGWGGWWFWDPVENASFLPWLVGTALLHSAIVTEKRGALQAWTVFLSLAAFSFSMLGAFLVRSGVLTSVHAFAVDPARGVLLLSILAVAAGSAFALFAWRVPAFKPGGVFAPGQPREHAGAQQPVPVGGDRHRAARHAVPADRGSDHRAADLGGAAVLQPDLRPPNGGGAVDPARRAVAGVEARRPARRDAAADAGGGDRPRGRGFTLLVVQPGRRWRRWARRSRCG